MRLRPRTWIIICALLLLVIGAAVFVYSIRSQHGVAPSTQTSGLFYNPPPRTKTSGCKITRGLPDPACTPGAVDKTATVEVICGRSTKEVRHTSGAIERETFTSYGVSRDDGVKRENDHLISLELGGADNDIANHFPQAYEDPVKLKAGELTPDEIGAHAKDKVENWFHARLCDRRTKAPKSGAQQLLPLLQEQIATNWISAYDEYLKRPSRKGR